MDTPRYEETINLLKQQVSKYDRSIKQSESISNIIPKSILRKTGIKPSFKPSYTYLAIPALVFVLLLLVKPSFLTKEYVKKDNTTVAKIQMSRLLIITFIISFLMGILLSIYSCKNKPII